MSRQLYIVLLCIAMSLALTPLSAARSLTAEELVSIKWLTHPELAPDGNRIAFQVRIADMEKSTFQQDIFLHNLVSGETTELLFTANDEKDPQWSPAGTSLGFLSDRGDSSESEPHFQVWLLPLAGGEAKQLTDSPTDIAQFRFSADGRYIYYLAKRDRPAAQQRLLDLDDERRSDLTVVGQDRLAKDFWRYDLEEEKARLVYRGDPGIEEFDLSSDGKYIVYTSNQNGDPDRWVDINLYLLNIADSSATLLADLGNEESQPRFAPNSKAVAFLAPQDQRYSFSQSEIHVVELSSRRVSKLSSDIDLGIDSYVWAADSRSLIVNVQAGMQSALYRLSLADLSIDPILTGQQYIAAMSGQNGKLAVVFETSTTPPEIGVVNVENRSLNTATRVNAFADEIELPRQRVVTYRSADNTEIEAVLWEPVGMSPVAKYPAVIDLHGGPDSRTTNTMFNRIPQYLAAKGYVVLSPNYRGSQGYYAEFNVANVNDLGGRDYQDVIAGVDYLESLGYVDPEAIGITGGSYGGYLTNWAISQSRRFAAAVSGFGIFNFFTDYGGSEWAYWEREYLGNYWDNDSLWLVRSPMRFVEQITTPVLILHGEDDPNTFITNSMEMYRALLDLGRTVEFVRLPREGHGFNEPQHRVIEMQRTLGWFDRYLQPSRSYAVAGEIVGSESASLTFVGAQRQALKRLPPPDGQYVVVRLELSSRNTEPSTLTFDEDIQLITPDYQRRLASGLLVQNQLVNGASLKLRPEVFTAEIVFDLPIDASEATLRVEGFAPLRIRF